MIKNADNASWRERPYGINVVILSDGGDEESNIDNSSTFLDSGTHGFAFAHFRGLSKYEISFGTTRQFLTVLNYDDSD